MVLVPEVRPVVLVLLGDRSGQNLFDVITDIMDEKREDYRDWLDEQEEDKED